MGDPREGEVTILDFEQALTKEHLLFLLDGLWVTLEVAVVAIIASFLLGSILGVIRYTKFPVISFSCPTVYRYASQFTIDHFYGLFWIEGIEY